MYYILLLCTVPQKQFESEEGPPAKEPLGFCHFTVKPEVLWCLPAEPWAPALL